MSFFYAHSGPYSILSIIRLIIRDTKLSHIEELPPQILLLFVFMPHEMSRCTPTDTHLVFHNPTRIHTRAAAQGSDVRRA